MIALAPILHLPPVNKEQMKPYPLMRYLNLLKEIYDEVPLDELCEDDLVEEEKAKRKENTDKIVEWIQNCSKDSSQAALMVYSYARVITDYLRDLKRILKTAYERKLEKQRRQAIKKRWMQALHEVNPPANDAERYLTDDEQELFIGSVSGAIVSYLDGGKGCPLNDWRLDRRAHDYTRWTLTIKKRKEKEANQKQAEIEYDQYINKLSTAIEKLKAELGKSKKPKFGYSQGLNKFKPARWCNLPILSKQQIHNWSEPQILKSLPKLLTNLIRWDTKWQVRVFPGTIYESVSGIPCLIWYFDAQVLVTANLELKECEINRYYDPGYTVRVQGEGEKLGTIYLGPVDCDTYSSFTTPIALLSLLAKGDLEAPGISVIEQGFSVTTYAIQGFEEEVEIYDDFRRFIKDIAKDQPFSEALLAKGLIDEDVAKLVEGKAALPLPQLLGAGQTFSDDSDVIAELEAMGYKNEEIKEAMETASLSPTMPLEEKVAAVLEILNLHTL